MDNLSNPLNLLATNMCSPMVIYIVFVIVSGISLFMTRSALKRYNTEKMDTLFGVHLMNEIKMMIVIGVVIYVLISYLHNGQCTLLLNQLFKASCIKQ